MTLSNIKTPITLAFSSSKLDTSQDYPEKLDTYLNFTNDAVQHICRYFEIETFTRVGSRFQYIYPVSDIHEALPLLLKTGMINLKVEKTNLFGNEPKSLSLKFTFHDNDIGYNTILSTFSRQLNLELFTPFQSKVDTSWFIKKGVLIDIDRFSLKPVSHSALKSDEFILSTERQIKKIISNLFE